LFVSETGLLREREDQHIVAGIVLNLLARLSSRRFVGANRRFTLNSLPSSFTPEGREIDPATAVKKTSVRFTRTEVNLDASASFG
jgi:hypothetical protein